MTQSLRISKQKNEYKSIYPSIGNFHKQFPPFQTKKMLHDYDKYQSSTINHLDCYTNAISILQKQRSKIKLDQIKGKYMGGIDKKYICQIKKMQLVYNQQYENAHLNKGNKFYGQQLGNESEQDQMTHKKEIASKKIQQSPYNQLKQTNNYHHYSELTQKKYTSHTFINVKNSSKKLLKTERILKQNKKILQCENSGLKKIKKRILSSSVARLQDCLSLEKGWIKQMTGIYIKQQKQRKLLKQKILCYANII